MWDDFLGHSCCLIRCEKDRTGANFSSFSELDHVFDARIAGLDVLSCARIVGKLPTNKAQSSQLAKKSPFHLKPLNERNGLP
jgi:hypothetical protein